MDSCIVGWVESKLVPGVVNVLLRDCLQAFQVFVVNEILDLCHSLGIKCRPHVVSLVGGTVAIPAQVLHIS